MTARRLKPVSLTNVQRVNALVEALELDEHRLALAGVALTLAGVLDEGAGLATAAVARELRATLEALTDGSDDEVEDPLDGLSAPVRHPANTKARNPRS